MESIIMRNNYYNYSFLFVIIFLGRDSMQYSYFDSFKNFALQRRREVVFVLSLLIISVLLYVFQDGYASRLKNEEFNEIQGFLLEIREKDKDIYNKLEVEEVEKVVKGIDVSSWQGDINWDKVKNTGIDFVMIRCGFRNLSNDEIHEDNKFAYNIKEANRVGIPVGIYFYSTAINEKEVLEEATFVLNLIKDYEVIYPVVYDFELFNQKRTKGVNIKRINDNAVKFLDYLRAHGYRGMLYSNLNALNNYWNLDLFEGYKLWYAQYIDKVTYDGKYDMWQYTDKGRIDGIKGYVDLNESYYDYVVVND